MIGKVVAWVSRMLAEQDGTPSSKRVGYIGAFVVTSGCLVGALVRWGVTDLWVQTFAVYIGGFVVGYVGAKFADRGAAPAPKEVPDGQ